MFRKRPRLLFAALTLLASAVGASAQDDSRVYTGREAAPFQPFTFSPRASAGPSMRMAYYAPRRQSVSSPDSDDRPEIESRGSHPTVAGSHAVLRHGVAYAPSSAPSNVKSAIWAVNSICGKPYHWGGGHGSFFDSGYDCSGTVSYALHYAGVLSAPLASSDLLRYGERGHGRWITIYSRHGHTFAMIAGLRLDTTDFRYGGNVGPSWHLDGRGTWGFEARHPVGL